MFKRFGLGFAVGYVFGAQAGQKRYEEMTELAQRAADLPLVRRLSDQARDVVSVESGRHLVDRVLDRARHDTVGGERRSEGRRPRDRATDDRDGADDDYYDDDYDDYREGEAGDDGFDDPDGSDDPGDEAEVEEGPDSYDEGDGEAGDGGPESYEDEDEDDDEDDRPARPRGDARRQASRPRRQSGDSGQRRSGGDERRRRSGGKVKAAASAALERGKVG